VRDRRASIIEAVLKAFNKDKQDAGKREGLAWINTEYCPGACTISPFTHHALRPIACVGAVHRRPGTPADAKYQTRPELSPKEH
jgi:hypothetical protein